MTLSALQLAGVLPKNPRFREWMQSLAPECPPFNEADAVWFIRQTCGVESRRDIPNDRLALDRFNNLIRKPFVEWCEQLQEPA